MPDSQRGSYTIFILETIEKNRRFYAFFVFAA